MSYDGSLAWDRIEADLRREGFVLSFSCASFDRPPADLEYTGLESGWEMRRILKDWCTRHGIADYRIVRNTSYHKDLHGSAVYELWTRTRRNGKKEAP